MKLLIINKKNHFLSLISNSIVHVIFHSLSSNFFYVLFHFSVFILLFLHLSTSPSISSFSQILLFSIILLQPFFIISSPSFISFDGITKTDISDRSLEQAASTPSPQPSRTNQQSASNDHLYILQSNTIYNPSVTIENSRVLEKVLTISPII